MSLASYCPSKCVCGEVNIKSLTSHAPLFFFDLAGIISVDIELKISIPTFHTPFKSRNVQNLAKSGLKEKISSI